MLRPGYKCTEFYLTAAVVLCLALSCHAVFGDHWSCAASILGKCVVLLTMAYGTTQAVMNYQTSRYKLKAPGLPETEDSDPGRTFVFGKHVAEPSEGICTDDDGEDEE